MALRLGYPAIPMAPIGTATTHWLGGRGGGVRDPFCLQSLWSQVELEQDPTMYRLLRGWRLACNRSQRSIFIWDADLNCDRRRIHKKCARE